MSALVLTASISPVPNSAGTTSTLTVTRSGGSTTVYSEDFQSYNINTLGTQTGWAINGTHQAFNLTSISGNQKLYLSTDDLVQISRTFVRGGTFSFDLTILDGAVEVNFYINGNYETTFYDGWNTVVIPDGAVVIFECHSMTGVQEFLFDNFLIVGPINSATDAITLTLNSGTPSVATVPATLTIPANTASATATITNVANGTSVIGASYFGSSGGAVMTVTPTLNSPTLWNNLVARYCPSLDTSGNGTSTLNNLNAFGVAVGTSNGTLINMDAATDWIADTGNGGVRALDFDGSNDLVRSARSPSYPFTFCCWVKPRATEVAYILGYFASSENDSHVSLQTDATGKFRLGIEGPGGTNSQIAITSTASYALNVWHHIAGIVASDTDRKLYVNGTLQGTSNTNRSLQGSLDRFSFGAFDRLSTAVPFDGLIDDVCLFTSAKSAGDIAILANKRGIVLAGNSTPYHYYRQMRRQ
jgi:hypothetical protein